MEVVFVFSTLFHFCKFWINGPKGEKKSFKYVKSGLRKMQPSTFASFPHELRENNLCLTSTKKGSLILNIK